MRGHEGKVAVVTGSARGIGQAYAVRLAAEGVRVVVVDLLDAEDTLASCAAAGTPALFHRGDVSAPEEVEQLAARVQEELGGCDILVNNVGISPVRSFDELTLEEWRRVFAVNLESMFLLAKAFVPGMRAPGWGRIVNQSSGTLNAVCPGFPHYIASKGGVIGFTRALATELAADGITVNAIATSLVRTPATVDRWPTPSGLPQDEEFEIVAQSQAIKRVQVPADLAGALAFLTSDDAGFITAQTYYVDGGTVRV